MLKLIVILVLLVYLVSPIDLIPDFIPVLGYADDAIIVAIALRFATRRAGAEAIERHWPSTPEGLQAMLRLSGLRRDDTATQVAKALSTKRFRRLNSAAIVGLGPGGPDSTCSCDITDPFGHHRQGAGLSAPCCQCSSGIAVRGKGLVILGCHSARVPNFTHKNVGRS